MLLFALPSRTADWSSGASCHPMLPYLAQGANSALEDGAVLGMLLGETRSAAQIPQALMMYEKLRKVRGESIDFQTSERIHHVPPYGTNYFSLHQRRDFHMNDGPEQQIRDEMFKSALKKE